MYGLETIIALNDRAVVSAQPKTADSPVPKTDLTRAEKIEPKEYNRRTLFPFCTE